MTPREAQSGHRPMSKANRPFFVGGVFMYRFADRMRRKKSRVSHWHPVLLPLFSHSQALENPRTATFPVFLPCPPPPMRKPNSECLIRNSGNQKKTTRLLVLNFDRINRMHR